jgi:hypothetical protein
MKHYLLFFALGYFMQSVTAMGQTAPAPVTVVNAPTIDTALSGLDAKITQLLDTANKHLENANKSLGDATAITAPELTRSLNNAAASLGNPTVELQTNAQRKTAFEQLTGSEVFDDNAFGTMTAIEDSITRRDGTVVQRDATKYKMDSAVMKQITDYNTARDAALKRKGELQEAIKLLTQQMNETKDLVTISKLSTMITALNGQVQDCNQIILVSQADAQMMEKEMLTTSRIVAKGEREKKEQMNKRTPDAAGASGTAPRAPIVVGDPNKGLTGATPGGPNGTSSFAPNLRWGTYNTKPPAGSTGGGAAP